MRLWLFCFKWVYSRQFLITSLLFTVCDMVFYKFQFSLKSFNRSTALLMHAIDYTITLKYWEIFIDKYIRILSQIWFYEYKQYIYHIKQYKTSSNWISPNRKVLWVLVKSRIFSKLFLRPKKLWFGQPNRPYFQPLTLMFLMVFTN